MLCTCYKQEFDVIRVWPTYAPTARKCLIFKKSNSIVTFCQSTLSSTRELCSLRSSLVIRGRRWKLGLQLSPSERHYILSQHNGVMLVFHNIWNILFDISYNQCPVAGTIRSVVGTVKCKAHVECKCILGCRIHRMDVTMRANWSKTA